MNSPKYGDHVSYHLFEDLNLKVHGIFIDSFKETRGSSEHEMHKIYNFDTNQYDCFFDFEFAGVVNE
jgi:hypothetical protein